MVTSVLQILIRKRNGPNWHKLLEVRPTQPIALSGTVDSCYNLWDHKHISHTSISWCRWTCAMVPHTQSTIVLYTKLDTEHDQQPMIAIDCRPHLPHPPSWVLSATDQPLSLNVHIALADGVQSLGQSSRNLYAKNQLDPCSLFDAILACDKYRQILQTEWQLYYPRCIVQVNFAGFFCRISIC